MLLLMILNKIGKGIVLLEMTAFLYMFTCLLMPLVGYKYYTYDNMLSRLWVKYMPVSEDTYFGYTLPAIALFCLAITLPSFKKSLPDTGQEMQRKILLIKEQLSKDKNKGLWIMSVGIVISVFSRFLPASLSYLAVVFFFASFAGLLYIHFSPAFKYKKVIMILFTLFIMWNALQSAMFTLVAYMGLTIFSFFQVGKAASMLKKAVVILTGIVFFLVLQNVKMVYRKNILGNSYAGNRGTLFLNLFSENLQKGGQLFSQTAIFPIYGRTNQGFNVAVVMNRIPRDQDYDNGKRLGTVLASAFAPRFLWPDKPEAGGKFNMKYYAGVTINGWSTNVGPLGEGYGSFGVAGGIIYMFLLGLFLRWFYLKIFTLSAKLPLLICWLPVLFYDTTSSAETETLQIINSIVKSAFFIWVMIKMQPRWFGLESRKHIKRIARPNRVIPAYGQDMDV